jgi:hypothetical protein
MVCSLFGFTNKKMETILSVTYVTVQAAQQERSIFISSLLPLLSEYDDLQPSVPDAQSIVSNLKVCSVFLYVLWQEYCHLACITIVTTLLLDFRGE